MLIFGMTISSALFTDSQSRVWGWIFGQPERAYHLSELRRLTGLGSASLQRELNRLAAAGLVDVQAVGNLRCFQANPNSPVYAELVALTRKTLGTVPVLREALQALLPSLQSAWVYGSVAKQTDTAQSDIDVMLVGEGLQLSQVLAALEPAALAARRDKALAKLARAGAHDVIDSVADLPAVLDAIEARLARGERP